MNDLYSFTGLYPVTKTLRFELIPVGETLANIQRKGIVENDTRRADSYMRMKKLIDKYHKWFIDTSLTGLKLKGLEEFFRLYTFDKDKKNTTGFKTEWDAVKASLRKEIVEAFKRNGLFNRLDKKELIQEDLYDWIKKENPEGSEDYDPDFKNFTTYFTGFHKNRMNMYTDEQKATGIANRLVDENLPKFIDNMLIFKKIRETAVAFNFEKLCREMEPFLNVAKLDELFALDHYSYLLTQSGIDAYNSIIGGRKTENEKLQGINEYVNLYNQKNPEKKLPKLKMLYKQILSDRISVSWMPQSFENAAELLESVQVYYQSQLLENEILRPGTLVNVLEELKKSLEELPAADPEKIYIRNDGGLSEISLRLFGDYALMRDALNSYYPEAIDRKFLIKYAKAKETVRNKLDEQKDSFVTGRQYHSVAVLQAALDLYVPTLDATAYEQVYSGYSPTCVADYFKSRFYVDIEKKRFDLISNIHAKYSCIKGLLNVMPPEDYKLTQEDKDHLKLFLDSLLLLLHFIKPLYLKPDFAEEKDELFYGSFTPLYEQLQELTRLYDKVRNFATKKPYSTEMVKLNFECKNDFLAGWTDSKTERSDNGTQYGGYLFRCRNSIGEYDYFLGASANTKLFRRFVAVAEEDICEYERLDYYQVKGQTIYGSSYMSEDGNSFAQEKTALEKALLDFCQTRGSDSLRKELDSYLSKFKDDKRTPKGIIGFIKSSDKNSSENNHAALMLDNSFNTINKRVINNLKKTLERLNRLPGAQDIARREYTDFSEIMDDVEDLTSNKVFNYIPISKSEFYCALRDPNKPLYMFKISNKDLSYAENYIQNRRSSRGRENLHTMYFKALMSGDQSVLDLGSGKVFFRDASITEDLVVHHSNEQLRTKNPLNQKDKKFPYDIVKDKRYTVEKYQFHLSVTLNYMAGKMKNLDFNKLVCTYIKNNPDVNIIGIDRGERHLLYISVIDREGRLLRDENDKPLQYDLDNITGEYKDTAGNTIPFMTPYRELLDNKEAKRQQDRENWQAIESIKDLKAGYLSQVVHHISMLMVKYNAVVVLEDLNSGFKNSRVKVEKQVYQNFERALIEKLNYHVFKDVPNNEIGGLYRALQLTPNFTAFKDLTKQFGFLFYVPAWNTSKIDPVTGFVDLLKPRYTSVDDSRAFFANFDRIAFNPAKRWFEFEFDYSKFTEKAEGTQTNWVVCTHGSVRYTYNKALNSGKGAYEKWDVTQKLSQLFSDAGIVYDDGFDLKKSIIAQHSSNFFRALTKNLSVTLALRYSSTEDDKDYILSPVAKNGVFFCSETCDDTLPRDADANGAFNIARKGLWVLRQIDQADSYNDWTTKISNKEWLSFAQGLTE